jgi:hypothetical protein
MMCFIENAILHVDRYLARNAYTGKRWTAQLSAECEESHHEFVAITAARKVWGEKEIPYGVLLAPRSSSFRIRGVVA